MLKARGEGCVEGACDSGRGGMYQSDLEDDGTPVTTERAREATAAGAKTPQQER